MDLSKKRKNVDVFLQSIFAVLLFVLFVSVSVFSTLAFRPLYYFDIDYLGIPDHCPYDKETIRQNYDDLIDYNLPLSDGKLVFSDLPMSESGEKHFAEVKDIFDGFKIAAIVLLPVAIAGIFYFSKLRKQRLYLLLTAIVTVAIPLVLSLLIAINWETVFVKFHTIVFNNDDWIFNASTDPVILILPTEFFMHCAIMMVTLTFLMGGGCGVIWFVKRKRSNARKASDPDAVSALVEGVPVNAGVVGAVPAENPEDPGVLTASKDSAAANSEEPTGEQAVVASAGSEDPLNN